MDDKGAAGTLSGQFEGVDSAAAVAQMLGGGTAATLEVSIKAHGLPDKDLLRCASSGVDTCMAASWGHSGQPGMRVWLCAPSCSKSDAMAVIFASDGAKSKDWGEVGRTDTVANSLCEDAAVLAARLCTPPSRLHLVCPSLCRRRRVPVALPYPEPCTPLASTGRAAAPQFHKTVRVRYSFERLQPMRLVIFDVDDVKKESSKIKLNHQDFLGAA